VLTNHEGHYEMMMNVVVKSNWNKLFYEIIWRLIKWVKK
jgi:hypothetical protein